MLKGGALLFAIAISLIIAMICFSMIMLSSYVQLQTAHYRELDRLRVNSASGINILLSQYDLPRDKRVHLDLFGNGTDSIELYKSYWGIFDLISSHAFLHNDNFSQTAIEGYELEENKRFALYLADNDKPLSVCGKTVITGKSYLPKAGVKRAYIEGQYFSGDKLISGEINNSKKTVPPLDKELIQRLAMNYRDYPSQTEPRNISELFSLDSISNSFTEETLIFYSSGNIELNSKFISGNVIIISDKSIIIGSAARLNDIILNAPQIIVEENFHGTCQMMASQSIEIKKNCILDYPSALELCFKQTEKEMPSITLREGAEISGIVVSTASQGSGINSSKSKIIIEKEARVNGQVYSTSGIDLKGEIYGSLICRDIILSTPSSVYENHLLNATIDVSKLSKYFAGINIDDIYTSKKIMKWLY